MLGEESQGVTAVTYKYIKSKLRQVCHDHLMTTSKTTTSEMIAFKMATSNNHVQDGHVKDGHVKKARSTSPGQDAHVQDVHIQDAYVQDATPRIATSKMHSPMRMKSIRTTYYEYYVHMTTSIGRSHKRLVDEDRTTSARAGVPGPHLRRWCHVYEEIQYCQGPLCRSRCPRLDRPLGRVQYPRPWLARVSEFFPTSRSFTCRVCRVGIESQFKGRLRGISIKD